MEDTTALRRALQTVTGPRPTRRAVRVVLTRCHRMAHAFLRQRQQSGALREDLLGGDLEDRALDAIADLFERDAEGRFPELRRYYAERPLAEASSTAVEQDLRRLVVGTVSDWLFRSYTNADRSLANLLQALKRALADRDDVQLHRRGSTLWMEATASSHGPSDGRSDRSAEEEQRLSRRGERPPADGSNDRRGASAARTRQQMPLDELEAHLTGHVAERPSTPELLDAAIDTLRAHPAYRPAYPLTRLAQALRAARVRVQAVTEHDAPVTAPDQPALREREIRQAIDESLADLRTDKRSTYVDTDKLDESTYDAYVAALRDRLAARFISANGEGRTHYEALAEHLPGLTQERYRTEHRSRFEYLERCARNRLVERLRDCV